MGRRAWLVPAFSLACIGRRAEGKSARLIQTTRLSTDRLTDKGRFDFDSDFDFEGPVVSVSRTLDQAIEGFGGAFTEASASVFQNMPEDQQEKLIEMYYGPSGIGYTLGRIHINSCDFSLANYAFANVRDDWELEHFDDKVTHDTEALIPLVKRAQERIKASNSSLQLLASPWSPPAWMKTSGKMDHSDSPGLREDCKDVWALYFSKWISAYKAHGIPIWALTPQNEPLNPAVWEGCVYNPEQEMRFVAEHLGPAVKRDHPEVKILIYDHNKDVVQEWADTLYGLYPWAVAFVDGVAFHWYSGDQFEAVKNIHAQHPKALLLGSEATWERWRWARGTDIAYGDWNFGMGYAHDILNDLNAGAAGWIDWNILLDLDGGPNHVHNVCDAAMHAGNGELYIHPQYYAIGHFSKFIPRGSRRLESAVTGSHKYTGENRPYGTCTGDDGLEATSFLRPDQHVVVVLLNCGTETIEYKLQDGSVALQATIPAQSVQTWVLDRDASSIFAV